MIFNFQGDGLFARVDIPPKTIVAQYGGLRFEPGDSMALEKMDTRMAFWHNTGLCDVTLDIPKEAVDALAYNATLGHKANHNFDNNLDKVPFDSARFGLIGALRTRRPVATGEELASDYEYRSLRWRRTKNYEWFYDMWHFFMEKNPNHWKLQQYSNS